MSRPARWLAGIGLALLFAVAALWLAARAWLPTDRELAALVAERFEQRAGVPLTVGGARWSLLPVPALVLTDLATAQPQPITVRRVSARLDGAALWSRTLALDELRIEGAVLPRASVRALRGDFERPDPAALPVLPFGPWTVAQVPLQQLRLEDVTWIDRRDIALAYDGTVRFGPAWRPQDATLQRRGVTPVARLVLEPGEGADRWSVRIEAGGGTAHGQARWQSQPDGRVRLTAELAPEGIDLDAVAAAFGRRTPVAGRVQGRTQLSAEAAHPAGLLTAMRTTTRFEVRPATLTQLDLARAVRTAGIARGGQTALDSLTGTLATQGTDDGVRLNFTDLKARSGLLSASGNLQLFNRRIGGDVAVDIVDGVIGMPLKVGGTVDQPELLLTAGALAGAAVGSAVLPGVGTAIGARLGQRVEEALTPAARSSRPKSQRAP